MKKYVLDLRVVVAEMPREGYVQLQLACEDGVLPDMLPGQFVEVRIDDEPQTFLRRPISINLVDRRRGELWLLVHAVGAGTRRLASLRRGDKLNVVLPLGNGFTLPEEPGGRCLLVGGGVGVAPLLFLGQELVARGCEPTFLLGARTSADVLQRELFSCMGPTYITTEDGSAGERGFVTQHSIWQSPGLAVASPGLDESNSGFDEYGTGLAVASPGQDAGNSELFSLPPGQDESISGQDVADPEADLGASAKVEANGGGAVVELLPTVAARERFVRVYTCGPKPMMQAVARMAEECGLVCEASLENNMACGLGACLCCVEPTREGNLCVCREGPVFDTRRLWPRNVSPQA